MWPRVPCPRNAPVARTTVCVHPTPPAALTHLLTPLLPLPPAPRCRVCQVHHHHPLPTLAGKPGRRLGLIMTGLEMAQAQPVNGLGLKAKQVPRQAVRPQKWFSRRRPRHRLGNAAAGHLQHRQTPPSTYRKAYGNTTILVCRFSGLERDFVCLF